MKAIAQRLSHRLALGSLALSILSSTIAHADPVQLSTLQVPVQVLHLSIRDGGDRTVRIVANGVLTVSSGGQDRWEGSSDERWWHAGSSQQHRLSHAHETVVLTWNGPGQPARFDVLTHGLGHPQHFTTSVEVINDDHGLRLAHDVPVLSAQYEQAGGTTNRREVDAFVIGGTAAGDEVKVWDATKNVYISVWPNGAER